MKKLFFAFALLFLSFQINAQGVFEKKSFVNDLGQVLPYQILFPANYNPSVKYPVVLFLHGSGERGDDNVAQMKHGAQVFLNPENQAKFPAIVIFPQCSRDSYWFSAKIDRTQKPTLFIFDYSQNIIFYYPFIMFNQNEILCLHTSLYIYIYSDLSFSSCSKLFCSK